MSDNPVMKCLARLKEVDCDSNGLGEMVGLFDKLIELCSGSGEGSGNVAIAVRNGGVVLLLSLCSKIPIGSENVLVSSLRTLALFIHGMCSCKLMW